MTNQDLTVRTTEELEAAVERLAAEGGGTVYLEAGSYSLFLRDRDGSQTDAPVRITSLDPADPAIVTGLSLHGRENLAIDHVVFDSAGTTRSTYHRDVELTGVTGVEISDSVFRGGATEALNGTPGEERAPNLALIRNSDGVTLRDNHMSGYYQGVALKDSDNVQIIDNEITRFQGDGIRIGGVQDALIQGNHMHSMLGTSQNVNHSDMIQFWGTNVAQNNERVTIRENVIDTANGAAYQMIFGSNIDLAENGFLFKDIVIEENLLYGAHHHMISITQTDGMVVRQNTVLWNRDTVHVTPYGEAPDTHSVPGWISTRGDARAVVEGNIAALVKGGTGANGILTYDDPDAADHYARHFVNLDAGGTADIRDLTLRADSAWDGVLGASMTWSTRPVDGLEATALVARIPGDRSAVTLDARLTRDEDGAVGEDAEYVWTFADGSVRRGAVVEHDFVTPGAHRYVLEVRTADGRTDRIERKVEVADPDLLVLDLTDGRIRDESSYGVGLDATDGKMGAEGFALDGTSTIELATGAPVYSLDSFGLALDVTLDAGASGTLVELWKSFHGRIDGAGRFVFDITTTEGDFTVSTAAGAVPLGQRAEIGVVLDGVAGELRLLIDGEVEATAAVDGNTLPLAHWGLTLGNKFSGHGVEGTLHGVVIRSEPSLERGLSGVQGESASWREALATEAADEPAAEEADGPALDRSALLVELDFDDGLADGSGRGTRVDAKTGKLRFDEGSDGTGRSVALGDKTDGVSLSRGNDHLFGLDAFHVAFDLRRDSLEKGGAILDLHKTMRLKVTDDGRLVLKLKTDEGKGVVKTAALLDDEAWHAIELAYDDAAGRVELSVDGALAGHDELNGSTAEAKYWGLALGRTWGKEAPAHIDELRIWSQAGLRGDEPAIAAATYDTASSAGGATTLAAFSFDGGLAERDGRPVGVWADGALDFAEGRDGGALRIGDDTAVVLTRENGFLHERDAFAFSFDLKKDAAAGEGRVLHLPKAMTASVEDGELVFTLATDEGTYTAATSNGALDDAGWHAVEIGYDDAADRLTVTVDGHGTEIFATGTTAEAQHWGLSLGAAWGDALEGAVDEFEMREAPDWAMG